MREFLYDGKSCEMAKKLADEVIATLPEFDYIDPEDYVIWIALEPAPKDPKTHKRTIAEIRPTSWQWMRGYVEYLTEEEMPPYVLVLYPQFFSYPIWSKDPKKRSRVRVLIHEFHHIAKNKRGTVPHSGFGDEAIVEIYAKNLKEIRKKFG